MIKSLMIWFSLIFIFFLFVPPVHEYIHVKTCEMNGGKVMEVNYWSHMVCGGKVENFPLFSKINGLNDLFTFVFMIVYMGASTARYVACPCIKYFWRR